MPARPTKLAAELLRLESTIETALSERRGGRRLRRAVYTEFLSVLNGTGEFEQLLELAPAGSALAKRIAQRIAGSNGTSFALPRVIYENLQFDGSIESAIGQGRIHRSEWSFVTRLARDLNLPPSYGQDDVENPPAWMIEIDEAHQYLRVWIRELALQDMLLAGLETYLVPGGSGKPSTEIYGIVFGSYRIAGAQSRKFSGISTMDLNVERVCIQHRAKGYPSEVVADERSEATHLAMGEELFPYWHLMGDFHTHTYRNLKELYNRNGWNYSDFDEKVNIEWCARMRRLGHRPRVALIMTIARAARSVNGPHENWKGHPHVVRATIGSCHVFISAYRIRPDGRYSTEAITLKCPHLAGH